jgi:hypothetical protein
VRYTHFFFSSNFCHHSSGGAAVSSTPSQQDPYLQPCKDLNFIACSVQELWSYMFCCQIVMQCALFSAQQQHAAVRRTLVVWGSDYNYGTTYKGILGLIIHKTSQITEIRMWYALVSTVQTLKAIEFFKTTPWSEVGRSDNGHNKLNCVSSIRP